MKKVLPRAPKAYKDMEFLVSPEARVIRILAEYLEPLHRFRKAKIHDTIVFFGSARTLPRKKASKRLKIANAKYNSINSLSRSNKIILEQALMDYEMSRFYEDGAELAYLLTKWSKSLETENRFVVCSGGGPGIMEAANKGARKAGGKTIGLNISLPHEQYPNAYITPALNFEFHYFFMRKLWFMHLAKGMVMFPGGFGTIDEMMEILTLIQTQKATKRLPMVLYGQKYWEEVLNLKSLVKYRMVSPNDLNLITFANTPREAFNYLKRELSAHHLKNGDATYLFSE